MRNEKNWVTVSGVVGCLLLGVVLIAFGPGGRAWILRPKQPSLARVPPEGPFLRLKPRYLPAGFEREPLPGSASPEKVVTLAYKGPHGQSLTLLQRPGRGFPGFPPGGKAELIRVQGQSILVQKDLIPGKRTLSWAQGGTALVLMSDVSLPELKKVAASLVADEDFP